MKHFRYSNYGMAAHFWQRVSTLALVCTIGDNQLAKCSIHNTHHYNIVSEWHLSVVEFCQVTSYMPSSPLESINPCFNLDFTIHYYGTILINAHLWPPSWGMTSCWNRVHYVVDNLYLHVQGQLYVWAESTCICIVGTVDGYGYDGYTICNVYRTCYSILSILKPVFRNFNWLILTNRSGT